MDTNNNTDLELEEIISEEEDLDVDNAPYEIRTLGADFTLELLSQKINSGEIIVPDFQRQYVWPIKKASKLIESFLLGLPVPQVFLYQEASKRDLLVVDGQQRLLTSLYFMEGKFEGKTPFLLKGVKQKWEGKSFENLDEGDKRRLKNYILRATIFEQINPNDSKSVYEIFERLNTGGMPLTEQEVRNCVNRGTINLFLEKVNLIKSWRDLLGKDIPDKRKKDIEIILRVFALMEGWDSYKRPMKDFISSYMERYVDIKEEDQVYKIKLFGNITDFIFKEYGKNAFRLSSGRINIAVLDSVITAVSIIGTEKIIDFKEKLDKLKKDQSYSNYISNATTDDDTVKGRIKMAIEALK